MSKFPEGDAGLTMRAMELFGSSAALAAYMKTSNRQVIRWMLSKDALPGAVRTELERLVGLPPEELARTLHISQSELKKRTHP